MRNWFGFVFNERVFLCEPFHYSTQGILLLGGQTFTAKTGKNRRKNILSIFVFLLIFSFFMSN